MTDEQIYNMLSDLIQDLDYDIYKELFVYKDNDDAVESLIDIVKEHIKEISA